MTYSDLDAPGTCCCRACWRAAPQPAERALLAFPTGADFLVSPCLCVRAGIVAIPVPAPGDGAASGATRLAGIISDARLQFRADHARDRGPRGRVRLWPPLG